MNRSSIVEIRDVSKKFCRDLKKSLWYGVRDIAKELIGQEQNAERLRVMEFWALRNISFSVFSGEALGLLGRNGAGKTTLLRIVNGVIRPDGGSVRVRGTVAPLIELGAGFSPVLTGRENVYVNAAILGVPGRTVDQLIDAIVEFAEIGEYIDMPVQSYSEGMKARLGFSVAVHLDPDIMLVDEVLAVGDMGFQRKCLSRVARYLSEGGILVLVSHNMHLIQSMCRRCVVLDRGAIVFDGATPAAIEYYARLNESSRDQDVPLSSVEPNEANPVIIDTLRVEPIEGGEIRQGGSLRLTLAYRALHDIDSVAWGFSLWSHDLEIRIATGFAKDDGKGQRLRGGCGTLSCIVRNLPLVPRTYCVRTGIYDAETGWPIARLGWENPPASFDVKGDPIHANSRHLIDHDLIDLNVTWLQ